MIIFLKTATTGTPLEIEPTATLKELCDKANERMGKSGQLVFAGKPISPSGQTLDTLNITKEATLHFMERKDLKIKVHVEYNCVLKTISIPCGPKVTVRDLKREVRNAFPEEDDFGRALPELFCNDEELKNNQLISTVLLADDHISVEKSSKPVKCKSKMSTCGGDFDVNEVAALKDDLVVDEELVEDIVSNFASGASSNEVEIVFCFDTTGSMSSCIKQVRDKLTETVNRLMTDIPKLKIGIIAVGDYCDADSSYVIKYCDLCSDIKKLRKFVAEAGATGGGDAPEAYELALQYASKKISWTPDFSKALVMIGDEVPHPPSYTTKKINWFDELDSLASKGVKVYGVRALHSNHAIPFYEEMAERTGAISIHFSNFHLIVDMFLAICYRESGGEKLEQFEKEITKGRRNEIYI